MSQQSPSTRPPDREGRPSTVRALARLHPYARPAYPRLVLGLVASLTAAVVALLIPLVLQLLVDGPLSSGDRAQVWPAFGVVLGLGIVEALMIGTRRRMVLTPSTRVEATMRNALYAKLQDLPVAFHDRWQSGQLLSRSVSDLSLIRRWLAFGIVLLVVNLLPFWVDKYKRIFN